MSRAAHGATGPRRSENRSFAQLANSLITSENSFDSRLKYLLVHGSSLRRPVFAARLAQLADELPQWLTQADQLRQPAIQGGVNQVAVRLTDERVADFGQVLDYVAGSLGLPWANAVPATAQSVTAVESSLLTSVQQWDQVRTSLVHQPGQERLLATTADLERLNLVTVVSSLAHSTQLALTRGVGISAVAVHPAPLPASSGDLALPPTSWLRVGVSVTNAAYDDQPITLLVTLVPSGSGGVTQRQSMRTVLGPQRSYAFVASPFSVKTNEKATLTLTLAGAPAGADMTISRTFHVTVAPPGD